MITHLVSDWLFSPCCVEHQDEFIFERVAVAYSRDYNEVGRAQINPKFQASSYLRWLYSLVCVGPGRKPQKRSSFDIAQIPVVMRKAVFGIFIEVRFTRPLSYSD